MLYLALNKGGVFKFFSDGQLVHVRHPVLRAGRWMGRQVCATPWPIWSGKYDADLEHDTITIRGKLGWAKTKQMTTFNLVVLRALMFTVGRFFPDLIRKLLQRLLITGKKAAPLKFRAPLRLGGRTGPRRWTAHRAVVEAVRAVGIGAAQTSIYVVMSRTYQPGQLQPWRDLSEELSILGNRDPLVLTREF